MHCHKVHKPMERSHYFPIAICLLLTILFMGSAAAAMLATDETAPSNKGEEPVTTQDFQIYLPLVPAATPPSSEELIRAAEEAGIIDAATALLFQFYAIHTDPRLPQQYRGTDRFVIDAPVSLRAPLQFSQLSEAGQAALLPFLIPPAYTDSWFEARRNGNPPASSQGNGDVAPDPCMGLSDEWTTIERNGFKIWMSDPAQLSTAEATLTALTDTIHPALHNLLGVTRLSDRGIACNGGSDSYDIYLLPAAVMGYTAGMVGSIERDLTTCNAPSFMVIRDDLPLVRGPAYTLFDILAHEYMHTMQRSYDFRACGSDLYSREGFALLKWIEATAQWAIDFVYPESNIEHSNAEGYLYANNRDDNGLFLFKDDYDAYLFPFYLTHQAQDDGLIQRLYKSWETNLLATDGVDQVIEGGLKQRWPEFALYNLNQAPYDYYHQWDAIPSTTRVAMDTIPLAVHHPLIRQGEWQHRDFSGEMHRYAEVNYPAEQGLVVFSNMATVVENESIQLRHIPLRAEGQLATVQDLSEQKAYAFCLEQFDPDIVGARFVLSNSAISRTAVQITDKLTVKYFAMGCNEWLLQSHMRVETHWVDEEATWDNTIAVTATVIFSRTNLILNDGLVGLEFASATGDLDVTIRGMLQNRSGTTRCAVDFTHPVTPMDEAWLNLFIGNAGEQVETGYIGQGITNVSGITWRNCLEEIVEIQGPVDWFYTRDIQPFADGFMFSGTLTETAPLEDEDGSKTLNHDWILTALQD